MSCPSSLSLCGHNSSFCVFVDNLCVFMSIFCVFMIIFCYFVVFHDLQTRTIIWPPDLLETVMSCCSSIYHKKRFCVHAQQNQQCVFSVQIEC